MSRALNSNDASRYLWQSWRLLGLHPTKKYQKAYWCYAVFIFLAAVWHPFHLLLQVFYIDDYVRIINNLSISLTLLSATVKYVIMFYFTTRNLYEAGKYFGKLDGFAKDNTTERDMINTEIRLCHRLYYGYIVAYTMPLVGFAILGYYQRSLLFEGWFPFDWTASDATYYVAYGLQVFGTSITLMQNLTTDTSQLLYLLIALVHLRVIKKRLSNMGNIMSKSSTEQYEELVMCVHVFQEWMRLFLCIRPVVSTIMCVQFMVTAFVACFSAIAITEPNRTVLQVAASGTYLMIFMFEIFPCCWCVNELIAETGRLTNAVYNCNWYEQDMKFRRALMIFMLRTHKQIQILAGNLVPVSLQSFIAIVKFSFSMFTLLNEMRQ